MKKRKSSFYDYPYPTINFYQLSEPDMRRSQDCYDAGWQALSSALDGFVGFHWKYQDELALIDVEDFGPLGETLTPFDEFIEEVRGFRESEGFKTGKINGLRFASWSKIQVKPRAQRFPFSVVDFGEICLLIGADLTLSVKDGADFSIEE
jgi:hypothetical protein